VNLFNFVPQQYYKASSHGRNVRSIDRGDVKGPFDWVDLQLINTVRTGFPTVQFAAFLSFQWRSELFNIICTCSYTRAAPQLWLLWPGPGHSLHIRWQWR